MNDSVNFSNLKSIIYNVLSHFFERDVEIRFRPAYFPFTEPSAEVDIKWGDKWLEVMGCGMVHPNVLSYVDINTEDFRGYAFGCGIDRLAMIKYDIPDIRLLFENNQSLLCQFKDSLT